MQVIGIIGTRRRNGSEAYKKVETAFFEVYEKGDWICSGGCPKGGDRFAEVIAKKYGIPILIFYPNWQKHKRGAGIIRNMDIAFHSTILIACVAKDRKGGTENTIRSFLKCIRKKTEEDLRIVE
jgi:hypothetical protein